MPPHPNPLPTNMSPIRITIKVVAFLEKKLEGWKVRRLKGLGFTAGFPIDEKEMTDDE
jgi:hypothetical protein